MMFQLLGRNIARVLAYFAISPGSRYNRKELKDKTGLHNLTIDKTLKQLVLFNILKYEKKLFRLNLEEDKTKKIMDIFIEEYRCLGVPYNIFALLDELNLKLSVFSSINKIILFGSYAKLIYNDKSDVDIAIILSKDAKDIEKIKKTAVDVASIISRKRKKEVHLTFFKEDEMKNNDPLIKDIIRNGKRLA